MGVGGKIVTYVIAVAIVAALVLFLYLCDRWDKLKKKRREEQEQGVTTQMQQGQAQVVAVETDSKEPENLPVAQLV